jgi:hypothetical protein
VLLSGTRNPAVPVSDENLVHASVSSSSSLHSYSLLQYQSPTY